MTPWTQSSHIKGADKGVWCWTCNLLSKQKDMYRQISIRRTLLGNKILDHSDVVGAAPVGAAPTTSSFST